MEDTNSEVNKPIQEAQGPRPNQNTTEQHDSPESEADINQRVDHPTRSRKKYYKVQIPEEELRDLRLNQKMSQEKIAEKYEVSITTIMSRLKDFNIERSRPGLAKGARRDIPEEELRDLAQNQNMSPKKIGERYGASRPTIVTRLKELGIETKPTEYKIANKLDIPEEELLDLYHNQKLSQTQIAEKYNVNQATIARRLKQFNIAARQAGRQRIRSK